MRSDELSGAEGRAPGNSLAVQWLGLHAFTAVAWVPSQVGELRSHMLRDVAKNKKEKKKKEGLYIQFPRWQGSVALIRFSGNVDSKGSETQAGQSPSKSPRDGQETGCSTGSMLFPNALLHVTKIIGPAVLAPPTLASPQYVIWYTEAWSLDPVTIRWLLGDTSQHMMEDVSGTWESREAERGGSPILALNICPSIQTWSLGGGGGLCTWTPGLSPMNAAHLPHPRTWTTVVPMGMLKTLTRLSVPTLTHHWPGRRQRGARSWGKLAAEGWTPGDLGNREPPTSLTPLRRASIGAVPADEGLGGVRKGQKGLGGVSLSEAGPCGRLGTTADSPPRSWPLTQRGELETEDSAVLTPHHVLLAPEAGLQPLLAVGCAHQHPVLPGAGGQAHYLGRRQQGNTVQVPAGPERWQEHRDPSRGLTACPLPGCETPRKQLHISGLGWLICKMGVVLSTLWDNHRDSMRIGAPDTEYESIQCYLGNWGGCS